jgi:ceramide glucosyltransferase
MDAIAWTLLCAGFGSLAFFSLGLVAVLRHTARQPPPFDGPWPAVSLLKPLKGLEEELDRNLRSLYAQDYPGEREVVFATADEGDPALAVARAVAAEFPAIPTRFVRSDPEWGLNPKLSNLAAAWDAAAHDLVLQSDANVRVRPDYLRRIVGELCAERASLLSSMVVGTGERSAGAAMENLQLSAFIAPATCFALRFFGVAVVIGKSMLLRKSELREVGGLAAFKDYLTEDYLIGAAYQAAGKRVLLSSTTVENVNVQASVDRFIARHTRWLKMRAVIHVGAFCGDLMANPVTVGLLGAALGGFRAPVAVAYALLVAGKLGLDALVMRLTRGRGMPLRYLLLAPVKDLLMGAIWPYSAVSRTVEWRGVRLRVGKMSALRREGARAEKVPGTSRA